ERHEAIDVECLACMRRAHSFKICFVNPDEHPVVEARRSDGNLRQKITGATGVDGEGLAVKLVTGGAAAPHVGTILNVVDDERADVKQLRQREPVRKLL